MRVERSSVETRESSDLIHQPSKQGVIDAPVHVDEAKVVEHFVACEARGVNPFKSKVEVEGGPDQTAGLRRWHRGSSLKRPDLLPVEIEQIVTRES
jgi:hypothetical protein